MKNIYLIGDSIRFGSVGGAGSPGYGVYVKEQLAGIANVYAPNENCQFAQYTLRFLHTWINDVPTDDVDIVHWNNGLWDVLRLFGDDPLTDIETYGGMLKRVCKRIQYLFPKAKIIFASSTSVIEEWAPPGFIRYNHEIEAYNHKAEEVMNELGVEVNDLYCITKSFDKTYYTDWVHFNEKGAKFLANHIVERLNVL